MPESMSEKRLKEIEEGLKEIITEGRRCWVDSRPTPWEQRAKELWGSEGAWSDYFAWEEWINDKMFTPCCFDGGPDCTCHGCTAAVTWDGLGAHTKIQVYAFMVDAVDYALEHAKEAPDA